MMNKALKQMFRLELPLLLFQLPHSMVNVKSLMFTMLEFMVSLHADFV